MAVLSALRAAKSGIKTLAWPLMQQNPKFLKASNVVLSNSVRKMSGGGQSMRVMPSNHEARLFKDHLHFYVLLGAIPLGVVIAYSNLFIGKATLSEIPEGYEPKYWEYYRHPIERFFARYIYDQMETSYERLMHKIGREDDKRRARLLQTKVSNLMSERGDYKGWFYVPVSDRRVWIDKAIHEDMRGNEAIGPVD